MQPAFDPARLSRAEVFSGDGYPIASERLQLDTTVPAHGHDFCELALVVGGEAGHVAATGRRQLSRGDVVAVRPGAWHEFGNVVGLDVINIYLGPELLTGTLDWILDYAALTNLLLGPIDPQIVLGGAALERVIDWSGQLGDPQLRGGPTGPLRLSSLLGCVLADLADAAARRPGEGGEARTVSGVLDGPERTAIVTMASDPAHPWTIRELASRASVSPSHLQHRFATQFLMSPLRWLARHRAEQMAVRLVQGTDLVGEIGRSVGWDDPNYAARRFRTEFAMSPSAYRERFGFGSPPAG